MNHELPDVQAGFRKGRGTRDQIANICWIIEKAREFQKNIYFSFIDYAKAFDCVDHNKMWKILKEMGIPDHFTCLLRNLYEEAIVRTGQGTIGTCNGNPTSAGSWKKQESSRKTSISAVLTMPKPLTVWITTICGKFLKRWEYQTTLPASCDICMQIKKQQLKLDMEQQTGSKLGKEYVKAVYCHPAYLTYMQSTS